MRSVSRQKSRPIVYGLNANFTSNALASWASMRSITSGVKPAGRERLVVHARRAGERLAAGRVLHDVVDLGRRVPEPLQGWRQPTG
jgi:hypothetical protein